MKSLVAASICLLLAACATTPAPPVQDPARPSLYDDALFAPSSTPISSEAVFAMSPAMEEFFDKEIARRVPIDGKVNALVETLYQKERRKFTYDASETNNAAGVFAARSGNCLSYTIMTAAFAKRMGVPVQFHVVTLGDVWDRNNNFDFLIGHVNLTLLSPHMRGEEQGKLVDFTAMSDAHGQFLDDIGEDVIVSMFFNNRAAETMAKGDLDSAYWWARAATESSPSFVASYNTLGVIYLHHGNAAMAARVFDRVLEREPENVLAMSNQVIAFKALGRTQDADVLAARLTQIQPTPPFHYFTLGVEAMRQHDYATAKADFTKEVNRASYNHQFHFWLAQAEYNLGDFDGAQRQLKIAMENSPNDTQHDLYAAKLAALAQKRQEAN